MNHGNKIPDLAIKYLDMMEDDGIDNKKHTQGRVSGSLIPLSLK